MSVAVPSSGEGTFRVLDYYFSLAWNWRRGGAFVHHALGHFTVPPDPRETRVPPTPGIPPAYGLEDRGADEEQRFRIDLGGRTLLRSADDRTVFEHLLWHVNAETFRQTGNYFLVHAGSVATPEGVGLLLPAASGSGKTTLVAALVRAGFTYMSDEAGAIDPVTGGLHPYPKALHIKEGSIALFPELNGNGRRYSTSRGRHVRAEELRAGPVGGRCEVGFVVAPRYVAGAATQILPMSRGEAVAELTKNALNLHKYESRSLPLLARVLEGVTTCRLTYGDVEAGLAAVVQLTA